MRFLFILWLHPLLRLQRANCNFCVWPSTSFQQSFPMSRIYFLSHSFNYMPTAHNYALRWHKWFQQQRCNEQWTFSFSNRSGSWVRFSRKHGRLSLTSSRRLTGLHFRGSVAFGNDQSTFRELSKHINQSYKKSLGVYKFSFVRLLVWFLRGQLATGRRLKFAFCRGGWGGRFCPGALRQFTQWPYVDHPTLHLRSRHSASELLSPR